MFHKNKNIENIYEYSLECRNLNFYSLYNYLEEDYDEFSQTALHIIQEILKDYHVITMIADYDTSKVRSNFFGARYHNANKKSYSKNCIAISKLGNIVASRSVGCDEHLLKCVVNSNNMYENIVYIYANTEDRNTNIANFDFNNKFFDIFIQYSHCHTVLDITIDSAIDHTENIIKQYCQQNNKQLKLTQD